MLSRHVDRHQDPRHLGRRVRHPAALMQPDIFDGALAARQHDVSWTTPSIPCAARHLRRHPRRQAARRVLDNPLGTLHRAVVSRTTPYTPCTVPSGRRHSEPGTLPPDNYTKIIWIKLTELVPHYSDFYAKKTSLRLDCRVTSLFS